MSVRVVKNVPVVKVASAIVSARRAANLTVRVRRVANRRRVNAVLVAMIAPVVKALVLHLKVHVRPVKGVTALHVRLVEIAPSSAVNL
jgi:hypothetical protein